LDNVRNVLDELDEPDEPVDELVAAVAPVEDPVVEDPVELDAAAALLPLPVTDCPTAPLKTVTVPAIGAVKEVSERVF
jgi:hypothetical protein